MAVNGAEYLELHHGVKSKGVTIPALVRIYCDLQPWATRDVEMWNGRLSGASSGRQYVSGPIWIPKVYNGRNRTFFTMSLERDDDPRPLQAQGRVPTALERKGDFSQTLNSSSTKRIRSPPRPQP